MIKTKWNAPTTILSLPGRMLILALFCGTGLSQQAGSLQDRGYKKGILKKIAQLIESEYVLEDKAKMFVAEFEKKVRSGVYASITDAGEFAERITSDLQAITHDKHVSVRKVQASDVGEQAVSALHHPIRFYRLGQKENTGFQKLEWIRGHIGYLDIRRFYAVEDSKEMIEGAIQFLKNADAIIIDVRENGGGSGDYLSSYFLPHPTQLTGWYYRDGGYLEESWTEEVTGGPLTDVPLFVLIGNTTFSAAEIFAYDLQANKRAVLIGEPTGGGAHSIDLFQIDDQFEINVSTSRAVNPVTGTNWEGTGVLPDVQTAPEQALDTAIELAEKAGLKFAAVRDEKIKAAVDRMQTHLDSAEKDFQEKSFESGRAALDSLFHTAKESGLLSEFFMFVFAYHYLPDSDNPILDAILDKWIEYSPESMNAHRMRADLYCRRGLNNQAILWYQKVLKLDPRNSHVLRKLEELKNEK